MHDSSRSKYPSCHRLSVTFVVVAIMICRMQLATATLSTTKLTRHICNCAQQVPTATFLSCNKRKRTANRRGESTIVSVLLDPHSRWHRALSTNTATEHKYRVYIAVGSNLGDRFANIRRAMQLLSGYIRVVRTSFLHETGPMYVTDQPAFLNGAVLVETDLEPLDFLRRIKEIEGELGRDFSGVPNGPRPVDLDILLYESVGGDANGCKVMFVNTPELTVPHPRITERVFVMIPLIEIAGPSLSLPGLSGTLGEALAGLQETRSFTTKEAPPCAVRVLPLPRGRMLYFNETIVMGILNATPDSFSNDGNSTSSVDSAVQVALAMEQEGAGIIDIGGESTRPGALEVAIEEEVRRTIPIIEGIRKESDVPISIDTRHAAVARAAVVAGADIVNDVTGGTFDENMLGTVGKLGVPMIIMHMRGTPETMQSMTAYDNVVTDVAAALLRQSTVAEMEHAVHRWTQVVDPGIGFAKDLRGNLLLLKNIALIRSTVGDLPILIGSSRKSFIGQISGVMKANDRDAGTIASCVAAVCLEDQLGSHSQRCSILRVHNVVACKQAAMVMDAIRNVQ